MYDLVIEGRVLKDGALVEACICLEGERVARLMRNAPAKGDCGEIHRLGSSVLLPGVIDTHVHFRDPGLTAKEDFFSGSVSAAFGGVTLVIDMPNTKPPTTDLASLAQKEMIASSRSVVDFGLNLAVTGGSDIVAVDTLLKGKGDVPAPAGLKAFLGETTGSLTIDGIGSLSRWAPVLESNGAVMAVHAEDGSMFREVRDPGSVKEVLGVHDRSRPAASEVSAISQAIKALGKSAGSLHILHVSTAAGLEASKTSKATVEVTPHHLLLDVRWAERNLEMQGMGKVNPPLRSAYDRAALWRGIEEGSIATIGSDHAPHTLEEKSGGLLSPSGMPGVETMAPLLLKKVSERTLDLSTFVRLCSSSPARRYSLEGRGAIEEGSFADIMAVDLRSERRIRGEDLHSKCGWTPYEGMQGIFPSRVYGRGELIVEGENLCVKGGRGRNIGG